jgi:hypothetical protein
VELIALITLYIPVGFEKIFPRYRIQNALLCLCKLHPGH